MLCACAKFGLVRNKENKVKERSERTPLPSGLRDLLNGLSSFFCCKTYFFISLIIVQCQITITVLLEAFNVPTLYIATLYVMKAVINLR